MNNIKYLTGFLLAFLFLNSYGKSQAPVLSLINSVENPILNGTTTTTGYLKIIDTTYFIQQPTFRTSNLYTLNSQELNLLAGTTKYPGDSIPFNLAIDYNINNLPFFPIKFEFELKVVGSISQDTIFIADDFYVFFTPYNTVEIWNLYDYTNLRRRWLNPDLVSDTSRVYINPSDIPVSNIEPIDRTTEVGMDNDWEDEYRIRTINNLAYEVLMKAVPIDSIAYYASFGDEYPDVPTNAPLKRFHGTVIGSLKTTIENENGILVEIPLTGIKVKLKERDNVVDETFEETYTDSNGDFRFDYDENQAWEGQNIELYIKFKSRTDDNYKIRSFDGWGANYQVVTYQWDAPEDGGTVTKNYNLKNSSFKSNPHPAAFRVTHWANRGYSYLNDHNVAIDHGLRLNINSWGSSSWYNPYSNIPGGYPVINLKTTDDAVETTTFHEFGHHVMYRLQGNHFMLPHGTEGFSHGWHLENTSKLAWVEGWADFIQMMLDAAYWDEDGEYGKDRTINSNNQIVQDYYETREHYSWPSWYIENGFRSEYYFACALYDLWDGPNKGLPDTILDGTGKHGWNDSGQNNSFYRGWRTEDDIEFDLALLCAPLQLTDYPERIQDYYSELILSLTDNEAKSDISRAFRENRVLWNAHEYEWGWHNTSLSTDKILIEEEYDENPSGVLWGPYTDFYNVNFYNKEVHNYFSFSSSGNEPIIDNLYLGIWDTYSNMYSSASLTLEQGNYSTYGQNRIYIRNGVLNLGINNNTTQLIEQDNSLLCLYERGTLNVNPNTTLVINNGATLVAQAGSFINVRGNGRIIFKSGSYACLGDNVTINLQDPDSKIEFETDVAMGLAPDILDFTLNQNCKIPPQIDFIGDGIIIYNCGDYITFTHDVDYFVTENETWSDIDQNFKKNLIVVAGKTLTINNNCKLEFNKGSKVIVEPGAKLIISQSVLSKNTLCSESWQGIEVWGNKNIHQWPDEQGNLAQGYLKLNNAVIENAVDAVVLWNPGNTSTTGGIVIADNTVFRNNNRSIHALYYRNYNPYNNDEMEYRAVFNNCDFKLDSDYLGSNTFAKHIDLNHVKGVRFTACDFSLASDAPNVSAWNMGIGAYSAGFSAGAKCNSSSLPCNDWQNSTFNGFTYGIFATGDQTNLNTFNISRTHFNNNTYGIYNLGVKNFVVLNSEFRLGYNAREQQACEEEELDASGFGIYTSGANGFSIEENYFAKSSSAPSGNYTGILCKESKSYHDIIYRNTFNGLSYGNFAEGDNRYLNDDQLGLEYQCNINTGNNRDFIVTGGDQAQIRGYQGTINKEAGNTFSSGVQLPDGHFKNTGTQVINYFYKTNPPVYYTPFYVLPIPIAGINTCPPNYGGGGGTQEDVVLTNGEKQAAELAFANNLTDFNNVKSLFDNLTDGGNTQALKAEVETAWPSDMWELRAELLGKSPHLSKEVLVAAADKTDVLPESILFEILSANPDELRKEELMSHLENKDQPLPAYMISILRQLAGGITYKTILLQDMASYQAGKTQAAYKLIRSCLNDSATDYSYLRTWLNNLGNLNADMQIVSAYLAEDNYAAAQAMLNLIPATRALEGDALAEYNDYNSMMQMQMAWKQQNRTIYELDSLEVGILADFAENASGKAALIAKGLLEYAYDHHYCNCLPMDDAGALKSAVAMPTNDLDNGLVIKASPNPASTWVAFDFTLPVHANEAVLQISDAHGRSITAFVIKAKQGQQLWDIRDVKKGVYLYTLKAGAISKHGKLIIN